MSPLRCDACGNKTRFFTLGGELHIESEEVLTSTIDKIVCRWCGSPDAIVREESDAEAARREPRS